MDSFVLFVSVHFVEYVGHDLQFVWYYFYLMFLRLKFLIVRPLTPLLITALFKLERILISLRLGYFWALTLTGQRLQCVLQLIGHRVAAFHLFE